MEIKLSIIILNHNTKNILFDCLKSLEKVRDEVNFEVIVSDNNSNDGSCEMVRKNFSWVKLITGPNISFSNGNNRAKSHVKGNYVLFLNSDTIVYKNTLNRCLRVMEKDKKIGALTCKLVLKDGTLDKDTRRRFPTPFAAFFKLFLGLNTNYWYEDQDEDTTHEVDAIQGAFILTRKKILDKVEWFDEKFIFDGEDLDLCFQIKKLGYKIIYYPEVKILHLKKATKMKIGNNVRIMQGVDSMEYFYKKNLWKRYPLVLNFLVLLGIKFLKLIRYIKSKI